MTTIVMLPAPSAVPPRGGTGADRGPGGTGTDFAAMLDAAVTDRASGTGPAAASPSASGPAGEPATDPAEDTGTTEPADPAGSAPTAGPDLRLVSVGQIVQAAAGMLGAGQDQTTVPVTTADPTADPAQALVGAAAGPAGGRLADVIDLAARRTAHRGARGDQATGGVVPNQTTASGAADQTTTSAAAEQTGVAVVPGAAGTPTGDAPAVAAGGGAGAQAAPVAAAPTSVAPTSVAPTSVGPAAVGPAAVPPSTVAAAGDGPSGASVTVRDTTAAAVGATAGEAQRATSTDQPGAAAPATATSAPASSAPVPAFSLTSAPHVAAAGAAPTVPAPAPVEVPPLATQLGARLAGLRTAPVGEHVLTMRVDPESIGPVRVVAHIGPDGVRIELLGATPQARDALRAALPDLRRDLVAAGLPADLGLGSGDGSPRGQGSSPQAQDFAPGGQGNGSRDGRGAPGTGRPTRDAPPDARTAPHTEGQRAERTRGLDLIV